MENLTEIKNAILDYLSALRKMRQLNITPNSKDFTSQLGEWLVEQIYEGKRAESGIQKCWDVIVGNKKIQVKTHAKANINNEDRTSEFRTVIYPNFHRNPVFPNSPFEHSDDPMTWEAEIRANHHALPLF